MPTGQGAPLEDKTLSLSLSTVYLSYQNYWWPVRTDQKVRPVFPPVLPLLLAWPPCCWPPRPPPCSAPQPARQPPCCSAPSWWPCGLRPTPVWGEWRQAGMKLKSNILILRTNWGWIYSDSCSHHDRRKMKSFTWHLQFTNGSASGQQRNRWFMWQWNNTSGRLAIVWMALKTNACNGSVHLLYN